MEMNYTIRKLLLVLSGIFFLLPLSSSAKSATSKHYDINWSININQRRDSIRHTLFNLGLISNIQEQRGLGVNVLYSAVHNQMNGLQFAGILSYASNMNGAQVGGLANLVKNNANGLMLSGLVNAVSRETKGIQIAGLTNISGEYFNGLALAGLMNVSADTFYGIQLSALLNANAKELRGLQISLLSNLGTDMKGFQWSMISNIAANEIRGVQLAGVANIAVNTDKAIQFSSLTNVCMDNMKGVQLALGNYAENVKGVQIGLLNLSTGKVKGWQIGVVNHSKDTTAHKIGLVNVTPKTRIQALAFGGNTSKINVAVRFKNKRNYSILGLGTHYLDMNDDFSGCLFYRTGIYFPLKKHFEISGDLGYFHIENFEDENADVPDRMYSLQARVNLSYQIIPKLGVFASTGFAMTRYYKKNKLFENKGIIECGIILF